MMGFQFSFTNNGIYLTAIELYVLVNTFIEEEKEKKLKLFLTLLSEMGAHVIGVLVSSVNQVKEPLVIPQRL